HVVYAPRPAVPRHAHSFPTRRSSDLSDGVLVRVIERRHDQPFIGGHRHTKVDALLDNDFVVFRPARVDHGEFANPLADGFHHKRHKADTVALTPLEVFFVLLQPPGDVGHIALYPRRGMWRGTLAAHHLLGESQSRAAGRAEFFCGAYV